MALPLATTARSCSSGGTTCAECRSVGVNTCARPSRAARMSLERLSRSDTTAEGNLQPKSQPNNAGKPHDSHQNRVLGRGEEPRSVHGSGGNRVVCLHCWAGTLAEGCPQLWCLNG